jgi:D-alanyl-D-alanine carboxypeptidase (penicillin-binding protein 5/6)
MQVMPAAARTRHRRHRHHHRSVHLGGPVYHAELLEDADSGAVLYSQNATIEWPPASMAKMMLLLVASDQIRAGRASLEDPVRISERAAMTGGSRLGLREGQVYPLGELMKAALIRSANDAAVAIAEKIGGSVEGMVHMMNQRAETLGMNNTYYGTVDGLPPRPGHDVDHTTAMDLAILARTLIHNTNLLQWSAMEEAPFDGGIYMLRNTNHLVGHFTGCDGLKTGFTMEAGFNLTATAKRGDLRLVSIVLGAPSNPQRFIQSARLLQWGFDNFEKVQVLKRGEPLPVHVQVQSGGELVQPVAESDISLVMRKDQTSNLKVKYNVPEQIAGPIAYGQPMGEVLVFDGGEMMTRVDAICPVGVGVAPRRLEGVSLTGQGGNSQILPIASPPMVHQGVAPAAIGTDSISVQSAQERK